MKLLFVLVFLSFQSLSAQQKDYPFKSGEKVNYKVYYNLAWVWVEAASVSFSVKDSTYQNNKAIYFSSNGQSLSSYDWIFKVRDRFSAFSDPKDLSPYKYVRDSKEGSHFVYNRYFFSRKTQQIFSFINDSDKPFIKDTLSYQTSIYDILSATYFLRNVDFKNKNFGDTIPVNTVMDNELIKIKVVCMGEDSVEHRNGKKYACYKFKTKGVEGSIFDKDSELIVWVSRDKNKIPIKIESKILVGSVKAFVSSVENLKEINTDVGKDFTKKY